MKQLAIDLVLLVCVCHIASGEPTKSEQIDFVRVYQVNKKISDFPEKEDLSTPEAAYAVINRVMASGWISGPAWQRVSVERNAKRLSKEEKRKVKTTDEWLNARIVEVRIFKDTHAVVIAEVPSKGEQPLIDKRSVELENGKWLNAGQSCFGDIEAARAHFARKCARLIGKRARPKIDDPENYLKPFVEFLKNEAQEPKPFVMKALAAYKVTIMGEIHHRPRYWSFNSSLVTDPDFAKYVGTIYMELPSNNQELIDEFLAGKECDTKLVIEMLRDMLWLGWPDKPMLDFFIAVWKANQNLSSEKRLRIVLVDMQRPWEKIQQRGDQRKYDVDRDKFMAENIIQDINNSKEDKRNGFFIVGVGHTGLNLQYIDENSPVKMAGWYLKEELGAENVYALFQHRCVMTNMGRVDGRLCMGLFDSAFAVLDNKPMAFPLDVGPFGKEQYDADPDQPVQCNYRDGFSAYLYLGPLEDEIFSPLIEGFYTDEFVKETERRHRLTFGKGWAETYGIKESNANSFISWMSGKGGSWGRPRKWRNELGPIDAWKSGDNWEEEYRKKEHKYALEHPEVIKTAAEKLFNAVRNADYEYHSDGSHWKSFLPETTDYQVHHHFDSWVQWICKTFRENPIESVELDEVSKGPNGLPTISYVVSLRDGRELKGLLPFKYMPRQEIWMGTQGIDWHLKEQ
jgi:hypothetical protein